MFDDGMFEDWLDKKASEVLEKLGRNESIRSDEMMILVLKAQANHFMHLDTDLRKDMRDLREDMNGRFVTLREDMNTLREDMNRRFEASNKRSDELREDMRDLREDMNKRFEAGDRRSDELREDMNKRFNSMQWLIGVGITFLTVLMSLYQFLQ